MEYKVKSLGVRIQLEDSGKTVLADTDSVGVYS